MTSLGVAYLIETLSKIKSLEKIFLSICKPHLPPLIVLDDINVDVYALLPVLKLGDLPKLKKLFIDDCKPLVFLSLLHPFRREYATEDPRLSPIDSQGENGTAGIPFSDW